MPKRAAPVRHCAVVDDREEGCRNPLTRSRTHVIVAAATLLQGMQHEPRTRSQMSIPTERLLSRLDARSYAERLGQGRGLVLLPAGATEQHGPHMPLG